MIVLLGIFLVLVIGYVVLDIAQAIENPGAVLFLAGFALVLLIIMVGF